MFYFSLFSAKLHNCNNCEKQFFDLSELKSHQEICLCPEYLVIQNLQNDDVGINASEEEHTLGEIILSDKLF